MGKGENEGEIPAHNQDKPKIQRPQILQSSKLKTTSILANPAANRTRPIKPIPPPIQHNRITEMRMRARSGNNQSLHTTMQTLHPAKIKSQNESRRQRNETTFTPRRSQKCESGGGVCGKHSKI